MTLNRSRSMNSTATPWASSAIRTSASWMRTRQQRPVGQVGERVVERLVLERGRELVALDGDGRQVGGPLHRLQVGRGQVAGHPVEDREHPDQLARARGAQPAGAGLGEAVVGEELGRRTQVGPVDQVEHEHLAHARAQRDPARARSAAGRRRTGRSRRAAREVDRRRITPSSSSMPITAVTPSTWRSTIAVILPSVMSSGRAPGDGLEQVGLLGQQVLGPLAVADVAEVDHEPAHRRVVEPVGHPQADRAPAAVAVRHPELVALAVRAPRRARTASNRPGAAVQVVGVDHLGEHPGHEVVGVVAEHLGDGRADVADDTVAVGHHDQVGAALHHGLGPRLAAPEGGGGLDPVGRGRGSWPGTRWPPSRWRPPGRWPRPAPGVPSASCSTSSAVTVSSLRSAASTRRSVSRSVSGPTSTPGDCPAMSARPKPEHPGEGVVHEADADDRVVVVLGAEHAARRTPGRPPPRAPGRARRRSDERDRGRSRRRLRVRATR